MIIELEGGNGDLVDVVRFVQRSVWGAVNAAANGEVDVSELEHLGLRLGGVGEGVFGWAEQPGEVDDAEVPHNLVVDPPLQVSDIEDEIELAEDGDVGRVGAILGVIFL